MKYAVQCKQCKTVIRVRGSYDPSVNALELSEIDPAWGEGCIHLKNGDDYNIVDEELIEID